MNNIRILLASILLIVLIGGCASTKSTKRVNVPLPPGTLDAAEVTALFSEKTVESTLDENGRVRLTYYSPNGELRQQKKGEKRGGTWWVKQNGRICLQFEGGKKTCRVIVKEGSLYRKYIVKKDGNHQGIITYTSFRNGNLID